jgi:molybdate-binding protein/DNA-binding XRE family transcriptional regulator
MSGKVEIENNLALLRQKRGLAAAHLAKTVGVSRQTIYAMEAGTYVPNTAVALKLARALEVRVEELFALPGEFPAPEFRMEQATLLPGAECPQEGQPVELCRVDDRMVASAPAPIPWYFPASDAIVAAAPISQGPGSQGPVSQGPVSQGPISRGPISQGKVRLRVFDAERQFQNRVLLAGCDPAISVLARHVQSAGSELVVAHRNSSQALELLKERYIHVAGTHLRDDASGESNLPDIARMFPRNGVAVVSFAVWEEGIVTARGNPKAIRGVEDFARRDVTMVNREAGAGSRKLLDSHLKRLQIAPDNVRGYQAEAAGHLPAAWRVQTGEADCCIATGAAARLFGLGFVPLVSERYDLAIRRQHLDLPGIRALLDVLSRSQFRRELDSLGGYDTRAAGERLL